MGDVLKRTPLHEEHEKLGGKSVPFAGFEMPVQYPAGITAEHLNVRKAAGLFDVCHMGEFRVRGPQALDLIQYVTVNDASKLTVGQAHYSAMCMEHAGIVDDLLVYRFPDHYMLVVNASNKEKDLAWIQDKAPAFDAEVIDKSARIVADLTEEDLDEIGYYRFGTGQVASIDAIISRTGYTGEDGFELYVAPDDAVALWTALMDVGEGVGLAATGLGARDSLRLEMGYALYGNDLDDEHTPLESGLGWITKLDAGDFIGRDVLVKQKEEGVTRKLVGMTLTERGFSRHGYPLVADGSEVGVVTSGIVSPSLGVGVAMGYVTPELASADSEVGVLIRDKAIPAVVQRPPFYKDSSIRR